MKKNKKILTSTNVKRQIVEEIHKPARKNFKRRSVIIKSLTDLFQADLVEMIPYSKENKGYKYILVVINCFSKFVWAFPLKSKTGKEVSEAMMKVFKKQIPNNLHTDQGKEFFNKDFSKLTKEYNVNHYNTFSEKKASIVERVNRTLKNIMWKEFNFRGNYRWIEMLADIVKKYNHTKHRTIGMKPVEVTKKNETDLLKTVHNKIKQALKNKFKLDDHVRISKHRGIFDKHYTPNWSTEIFIVRKVQMTNPTTYLLRDMSEVNIEGGFYEEQLQKVEYPGVFLVEKILKRKPNKVFVKWLGFSNEHNSWIDKNNIQ